jgi:hypothetical protein
VNRRIDWRRCLVQALWIAVLQIAVFNHGYFTYLELQATQAVQAVLVAAVMIFTWWGFAVMLAASAQWVEGRWSAPAIVALGAALCTLTLLQRDVNVAVLDALGLRRHDLGVSPQWTLWLSFASGAPFFWYCLVVQRSVRVRSVLARAELERAHTAALVGQAQADALEGRVEPALLQRALVALQGAYARERGQAEALLDALVDFLRQAMPAIRSGRSTLMNELTLLRRYAALIQRVDGGRRLCSVTAEPPPREVAFAPLLLVPLVEALAAAHRGAAPPHVGLTVEGGLLRLALDADTAGPWPDSAWRQRLERALRAVPDTAGARVEVGGSRALTLWLPLPPASQERRSEAQARLQGA